MSYGECPSPREDCKYAPECFSDSDHIIPRRLGDTALKRVYLNLPQFREQVCRREHEERNDRHNQGDLSDIPSFPSEERMRDEIIAAVARGDISLSKSMQKRLKIK